MAGWEYCVVVLSTAGYVIARTIITGSFIALCWKVTAQLSYVGAMHGITSQSFGDKQEITVFFDPSRGKKRWGVLHQHNTTWYDREGAMYQMASICMQYGVSLGSIAYHLREARLHHYCDILAKSRYALWFLLTFVVVRTIRSWLFH